MKKIWMLILIPLLGSCYEKDRNCADFRTGRFKFEHEVNGEMKTTYFTRTDSLEIETFEGKTDTAMVRWVSDCEYVLLKKNPRTMKDRQGIAIKILSTTGNSYTFEFGIVGNAAKQRGTVVKLN